MLQNVFQFRCPFRKYSPHLVPHSTRMNLGITQIITVILLIATIIGTCQRVSRSNLKIKPKYYALTLKPRIKFPPKIKFKIRHSYTSVPQQTDRTLRRHPPKPWPIWAPNLFLWKLSSICQKPRQGYPLRRM